MNESVTDFMARVQQALVDRLQEHYEVELDLDQDATRLITDTLADLRHVALRHHVDFDAALTESLCAYQREREDILAEAGA